MITLKISQAVSQKLFKICNKQNISINRLATISCLTQSTIQNIIDGNSKNPKLLTIVRICDGLNITLKDFFDDELFENLERED